MKLSHFSSRPRFLTVPRAVTVACIAALACAGPRALAQDRSELDSIWNDPVFQRQFVGGYGINADVEPRMTQEEVALLEKVRPLMADEPAKAEALLRKQIKPTTSANLDFLLGGVLSQQEKTDEARAAYQAAVAKFPSFRRAWRYLGLIDMRSQDYDSAIAAFTRYVELGGADAYSFGMLGFAHASKLDFQPAEAAYRNALLLQPENTQWRAGLTNCVLSQGKYEDAVALLEVLIARYPEQQKFWALQARAFLGKKEPLRAAQNLELLDRLGKSTLETLYLLGDIYLQESLADLAASAYRRAVDLDPQQSPSRALTTVERLAQRGAAVHARELSKRLHAGWDARLDAAERRRLLELDARLGAAAGDDGEEVVQALEEMLRIDPLDGEALMLLGEYHERHSAPDRALTCYERAEETAGYAIKARVRRAKVLVALGRHSDALPILRRAQEIEPREEVARYLEQVERFARQQKR